MNRIMSFTQAWNMFREVWNLYKKYALRKLNENEIEELVFETGKIQEKYKYPFTKDIVVAVVLELERSVNHFEEEKR